MLFNVEQQINQKFIDLFCLYFKIMFQRRSSVYKKFIQPSRAYNTESKLSFAALAIQQAYN